MSPVRSRETVLARESILARVSRNLVSKRYVLKVKLEAPAGRLRIYVGVYDQRENRFVPDDEIERIDPDEKMSLR